MKSSLGTVARRRAIAAGALAAVVAVTIVILLTSGGGTHPLRVQFYDAGQLVVGDDAAVAGRPIGTVDKIELAGNGLAEVTLGIDDVAWPLHRGTRATIRLRSLSGVANRYVELTPGDVATPPLGENASLATDQTRGVVDLDQILDSFDKRSRRDLQQLIKGFATAARGNGAAGNQALRYLNPALSQSDALMSELAADPPALRELLAAGSQVTQELGDHERGLSRGIENTAALFRATAGERGALAGVLRRAPGTLRSANGTLTRVRDTLRSPVRPFLRELRPSVKPLGEFLTALPPATRRGVPALRDLRRILPPTRRTLAGLPPVARAGVPAGQASTKALKEALPIFAGLRQYGPDAVSGALSARAGITGFYDANGHYARASINTSFLGIPGLSPFLDSILRLDVPGLDGLRNAQNERCPGAAQQQPAADGSKPVLDDPSLCDPSQTPR